MDENDEKRPARSLPLLIAGLLAGSVLAFVLGARGRQRAEAAAAASAPRIGRVGETGPQWAVEEKTLVHRSPGEVAAHLHDSGGLPGLTGGLDGPPMDHVSWQVPGSGRYEAVVHGLPGAGRTELTVRFAPEQHGARASAQGATAVVLGSTPRAHLKGALDQLRRELESVPLDNPHRGD